ncbi:uncharacterized protein LAESUDRAFT_663022 [Laetiporus sulphureus 93-53]|uniref:Uncharacterized protein n=1 Tax=Laetiporus sulphureus 93-53 TaxID=1314785 RepID=A0A165BZ28_9APHY|nr:uncharacterized protein LAESUDRAFT_663022 [Laetiporus sulphureus 93-53]KZT01910.1 hypothetical protein LAESUDRAFT_663022 [Laetiporus sulphureus 93-53]
MLLSLLLFLFLQRICQFTNAAPIPDLDSIVNVSPYCHDCRTPKRMVYGCVVTIFACIWGAIHPDMPDPSEFRSRQLLRRMGFALCALIAPELYVWIAARQWVATRQLWKKYGGEWPDWTHTHGFFLLMGCFAVRKEGQPHQLFPKEFSEKLEKNEIVFRDTTKEEIHDRSKANFLSKAVIMLQMGWFMLQIIARQPEGLVTSPLEFVTLAFTLMTLTMYFFWFHKPLDVTRPVILRCQPPQGHTKVSSDDEGNVTEKGPVVGPSSPVSKDLTNKKERVRDSAVVEMVSRASS